MKIFIFFLFFSLTVFSQSDKKKEVKVVPKTVVDKKKTVDIKKPIDTKKPELKKPVDAKKSDPKTIAADKKKEQELKDKLKLNDTIVTITKKLIDEAPIEEKDLSYDVAFRLLNACNTSKLKKFTDLELTSKLLKKITLNYISAICVNNNEEYGKFIGLELIEVLTNENIKTNIYRYKIEYERKIQKKEMRIYIDKDGLVSVIKTLRWKEKFELKKKFKPKPKKVIDTLTIIDESFIIRN
jgi:hypothetical protein